MSGEFEEILIALEADRGRQTFEGINRRFDVEISAKSAETLVAFLQRRIEVTGKLIGLKVIGNDNSLDADEESEFKKNVDLYINVGRALRFAMQHNGLASGCVEVYLNHHDFVKFGREMSEGEANDIKFPLVVRAMLELNRAFVQAGAPDFAQMREKFERTLEKIEISGKFGLI